MLYTLRALQRKVASGVESCLKELTLQCGSIVRPRVLKHDEKSRIMHTMTQYQRKADHVQEILGPWACDYFIQETNRLRMDSTRAVVKNSSHHDEIFDKILANHFNQSTFGPSTTLPLVGHPESLSNKAATLVDLVAQQGLDTKGVIFVKERAIVGILSQILSTHPCTTNRFTFATFVGLSTNAKRKVGIHELLDTKSQARSLEAFRIKQRQIIIATDVLEEGIDVAACNLVICFDPPSNLKSFIQRRGRARMELSQFVIMQPCTTKNSKIVRWAHIEEQMIRMCQDEERVRQAALAVEEIDEHVDLVIRDDSTGYGVCMNFTNATDTA
jgi:ERCC4-related helicase